MPYVRDYSCDACNVGGSDRVRDDGSWECACDLAAVGAECFSLMGLFAKVVW